MLLQRSTALELSKIFFAWSAEFMGGFVVQVWFFERCYAQVQAYPPSLPVDKPRCLSLAHKAACPQ
ncbi:hypothetical protein, partial [Caballeronia sp. 15711]|uniref:hypothetical protein n=1 Tax=Caballeronia sp. 15711 TaxID=3391029 RepID=UPI0039E2631D